MIGGFFNVQPDKPSNKNTTNPALQPANVYNDLEEIQQINSGKIMIYE